MLRERDKGSASGEQKGILMMTVKDRGSGLSLEKQDLLGLAGLWGGKMSMNILSRGHTGCLPMMINYTPFLYSEILPVLVALFKRTIKNKQTNKQTKIGLYVLFLRLQLTKEP